MMPRRAPKGVLGVIGGLLTVVTVATCARTEPATLIIHNARIHTMDAARPAASAIAVRGDRIARVGDDDAVLDLRGDATRVIDAGGATVVPGLHDAHGHVVGLGEQLQIVNLRGTTSYEQVIARVRERARTTPAGRWIIGRGWDQNDWTDTAWPSHVPLSAATPDHPVYLTRIDGHAGLANAVAMRTAGITGASRDPAGGRIIRDGSGTPIGVFVDTAENLVTAAFPATSAERLEEQILLADAEARRLGLTMVHDAGVPDGTVEIYRRLVAEGRLKTRLYVMRGGAPTGEPILDETHRLTVRTVKLYADGALGSRGAALLEPYDDEPGTSGLLQLTPGELYAQTMAAVRAGYQPAIHAIGDRGNRVALDTFERIQREVPDSRRLRMRIEHAQMLDARDVIRFPNLSVVASMQPTHATSDMPWVPARIGDARMREGAYVWRRLLDAGATIAAGSDFPVEEANPLLGFYAAITRQDAAGRPAGGWMPPERMSREQALRAFTLDAAYAAHAETALGSLVEGKLADLVMLSADIMTIPPAEVLRASIRMTVIAGEIVWTEAQPAR